MFCDLKTEIGEYDSNFDEEIYKLKKTKKMWYVLLYF